MDMDFWWRGRAEGTAEATAEPAEDMLLADISVRLSTENSWEDHRNVKEKRNCSLLKFKKLIFKNLNWLHVEEINISGIISD